MAIGVNFLPSGEQPEGGTSPKAGGRSPHALQQAIRLLNMRLPTVPVGAQTIAPRELLQAPGGQPGMNGALSMQMLQQLMLALAGRPQQAIGGMAPRVGIGMDVPPGGPAPGWQNPTGPISPPGPGNLPPMGPAPGWQNPRVANSHPGGEFGPTGPILPKPLKIARSHPGGEFGPKGPILPKAPAKPRIANSHPGGEFGPKGPLPRIRTVTL